MMRPAKLPANAANERPVRGYFFRVNPGISPLKSQRICKMFLIHMAQPERFKKKVFFEIICKEKPSLKSIFADS